MPNRFSQPYEHGFIRQGSVLVGAPEFHRATDKVHQAHSFVVLGHINPDADAIGSVSAVVAGLRQIGKDAMGMIGQPQPIDPMLESIPGASDIQVGEQLPDAEVIIVVDCGSSNRLGLVEQAVLARESDIILIDHHSSNFGCAGINLIDYQAESTTTVIRQWFYDLGISVDPLIAHALYAGLLTDTSGFRWGRPVMHELAQELVNTGLDIRTIGNQLFGGLSTSDLQLIGSILSSLRIVESDCHRIAVAVAPYSAVSQMNPHAVESVAEHVRGVSDADIGVVIKEYHPGFYGVSLRSDTVDVSVLARNLGGGGHLRSAGFTKERMSADAITAEIVAEASTFCPLLGKHQESPTL